MKSYMHPKIELFEDERSNRGDVIITLKAGWCFEDSGEHLGAYFTCREAMEAVHSAIQCTCSECERKETKMKSETNKAERPNMVSSIKLDRTIVCLSTKETWKNAYRMWLENPGLMTSSQQDRLTAKLYGAAKLGVREIVSINGMEFCLLNVEGLPKWEV